MIEVEEKAAAVATAETAETPESIQQTINDLQAKMQRTAEKEARDASSPVEMSLAAVTLKVDKNELELRDVTPAEALLLVAEHHRAAGGVPLSNVRPMGKVMRDPVEERARLTEKYGAKRVYALYPGAIPTLPKNFSVATTRGVAIKLPSERLLDFEVTAAT